ncbi:MAG: YdcH family protein [Rhodospirillaceae bacterium]
MSDTDDSQKKIQDKVAALELEHRDLDDVISNLESQGEFDQLKLSRLKKRKLMLKDQIASLRDNLFPDIIA